MFVAEILSLPACWCWDVVRDSNEPHTGSSLLAERWRKALFYTHGGGQSLLS